MNDDLSQLPQSQAAFGRLEQALRRLEGVAGKNSAIASELQAARDDYARLDDAARQVDTRLGAVIDRLKILLEE